MKGQIQVMNLYHRNTRATVYFKLLDNRQFHCEGEITQMQEMLKNWSGSQNIEISQDFEENEKIPLENIKLF
jgi:hypothetical protein